MKFLLTQFAEGSGGSFLMCVLAASNSVWHWDEKTQNNKTEDKSLSYIKSKFQKDYTLWIARDPKPQNDYNLHFLSTKYPRGDDLTLEEFKSLCKLNGSDHFINGINSNLYQILPWHKITIPGFFNNPLVCTIIIDKSSLRWYHRSLWNKKFGIKDNLIHIKADDPSYNPERERYFQIFNNPYLVNKPFFNFVKENIILNKQKLLFLNPTISSNNSSIFLSELIDEKKFVQKVQKICRELNLELLSKNYLIECHKYWKQCHE
jgi:hypothetical protein